MVYKKYQWEYTMSNLKHHVRLTVEERKMLLKIITKGTVSAQTIMHANVLLALDENSSSPRKSEKEIAKLYHVHSQTVYNIRRRYAQEGLNTTIRRRKRAKPPIEPKITGDVEAKIIALSCTNPPTGQSKWSLRLLANKAVELNYINSISYVAIGKLLKKRTKTASS
jgi:transposase